MTQIKLTNKERTALNEALRRFVRFSDGKSLKDSWTGLGHATDYKQVIEKGFMTWATGTPSKGCMGWLSLTDKGCQIVQKWLDDGYTKLFWDGNWEYVVNESNQKPPFIVDVE